MEERSLGYPTEDFNTCPEIRLPTDENFFPWKPQDLKKNENLNEKICLVITDRHIQCETHITSDL